MNQYISQENPRKFIGNPCFYGGAFLLFERGMFNTCLRCGLLFQFCMFQPELMRRSDQRLEGGPGHIAGIQHADPAVAGVFRMWKECIERGEVEGVGESAIVSERTGKEFIEFFFANAEVEPELARAGQSPRCLIAVVGNQCGKRHHAARTGEEERVAAFVLKFDVREGAQVVDDLRVGHGFLIRQWSETCILGIADGGVQGTAT